MKEYHEGKVWEIVLHIVLSSFLFGYNLGVFNSSSRSVGASLDWGSMQDTYTTVFSTLMPVGALIGASFTGSLMNHYPRQQQFLDSLHLAVRHRQTGLRHRCRHGDDNSPQLRQRNRPRQDDAQGRPLRANRHQHRHSRCLLLGTASAYQQPEIDLLQLLVDLHVRLPWTGGCLPDLVLPGEVYVRYSLLAHDE